MLPLAKFKDSVPDCMKTLYHPSGSAGQPCTLNGRVKAGTTVVPCPKADLPQSMTSLEGLVQPSNMHRF